MKLLLPFHRLSGRPAACAVVLLGHNASADAAAIAPPQSTFVLGLTLAVCILGALFAWNTWLHFQERRLQRCVERGLRESEGQFRVMIEGSAQGVMLHRQGVLIFANHAYAKILGYGHPSEVLMLGNARRIYAPYEIERMASYQRARLEGEPAPAEYDFDALRKDGTTVTLHNVVHLSTHAGEQVTQHNVTDVTERHRADELLRESEERYRIMVQSAPEALVVLDVEADRFVEANENALRLFGVAQQDMAHIRPLALSPLLQPDGTVSVDQLRDHVARTLAGETVVFEWVYLSAAGAEIPAEVRFVRLPSPTHRLVRASITDISRRLAVRRALLDKSAQLEATLENTDQGVAMIDANLNTTTFNQRFLELLDLSAEQFSPGDPHEKIIRICAVRGDYGPGCVDSHVAERLQLLARFEGFTAVHTRSNGRVLEMRRRPIPGGGVVTTYTDVTQTHQLSQQLAYQARHDSLTSLANRGEFEKQLERVLLASRDEGTLHAICYLDLDQFKVVNDTCGHAAGDELLRQLGTELRNNIRKSDLLARLGGDEFGALLENCTLSEAQRVANALRRCVDEFRFTWLGRSFPVAVSIGLVPVSESSGSVADVLSAADAACYAAKDQGRNRVHLYTVDDAELTHRHGEMQWVTRLQDAFDRQRLCLMYQTIVPLDAASTEGDHYELLVRMRDDDGGFIPPGLFLPAAERYNLIGRLDRWVVRHAFEVLAATPSAIRKLHTCSINLSGDSVSDVSFLDYVIEQFHQTGVPAAKIVFEITETAAITHLTRATAFMMALREIGCRFSLDDFGSGLSSFGYLKTLPVDYLKIDGMFVKDMLDDPIDHAMVKSINEIGHVMGKRTVAEFVENDAIRERLRELGVDYAQGYGIARPQPFPPQAVLLRRVS